MADNVAITAGSGTNIATDEVAGTLEHVQLFKLAISADGSRTLIPADATNGLDVDVTRLPALPTGSNNIGFVGITDGSNSLVVDTLHNDGENNTENHVDVSGKLMGFNGTTWDRLRSSIANGLQVDVTRITGSIPAGTNSIGTVVVGDGTNLVSVDTAGTDAEGNVNQLHVQGRGYVFNGSTWDRQRGFANVNRNAQYTATQTGVALWTPAAGRAVVVTALQIQAGGTTAGAVQVWFGGSADTTFTRGTDQALFDGEFAPSATNRPGVYVALPTPARGTTDFVLRVTTSAAINPLTVNVWGYEV